MMLHRRLRAVPVMMSDPGAMTRPYKPRRVTVVRPPARSVVAPPMIVLAAPPHPHPHAAMLWMTGKP